MKPTTLFLSGSLLGVCITFGVFYLRGPVSRRIQSGGAGARQHIKVMVPIRPNEVSLGAAAAPVTLIEYSDFQCPYCAVFRTEIFPKIKAMYIDSGRVRFIHRDLPLPSHHQTMLAAQAAAWAADQGLYWQLSDLIFSRLSCLDCQGVMELSRAVELDRERFEECVASNTHQPQIGQDIASAKELNFQGTPSFVVGRAKRATVEGVTLVGALPFEEFAARIDQFLARTSAF